jgi:hypothetical protein
MNSAARAAVFSGSRCISSKPKSRFTLLGSCLLVTTLKPDDPQHQPSDHAYICWPPEGTSLLQETICLYFISMVFEDMQREPEKTAALAALFIAEELDEAAVAELLELHWQQRAFVRSYRQFDATTRERLLFGMTCSDD